MDEPIKEVLLNRGEDYRRGFIRGIIYSSNEVRGHWNDIETEVFQSSQAKRSANVLLRISEEISEEILDK